jgi:hypothetical protein
MIDPVRQTIAGTLKREADFVAEHAARDLIQRWSEGLASRKPGAGEPGAAGLQGGTEGPSNADELMRMMQAGYQKLGGVVALSVLVDEPGLIVDDMRWLDRMFGERNMHPAVSSWQDLLLEAYVQACGAVLNDEESRLVRDVVDRAANALHRNERLEA